MKYYELDQEEKNILHDYEDDTLKYVKGFAAEKKLYQSYAKATLGKTKNINIRISDKDLMKIKAKAAKEGIPYQTLAASILHRSTEK